MDLISLSTQPRVIHFQIILTLLRTGLHNYFLVYFDLNDIDLDFNQSNLNYKRICNNFLT